ncbi:CAMK/CAMKL protein kinase Cdr2 [Schizosaccharomyces japonicus yFS275]|uniref:non-specific serine/threonine protein kinase n=1 Tax=Schizosaccharomyces japonicus (strain yFS275 / FY16936) TaxID=402676 RepID=B6K4P0_SCHJY|nr:CAMK/CAMKL protein kinase Cdr2 [Schizosaccharomyces japonicus yFS275]EEB08447.1 CAMK/CAMKL protein kinase Cdr2 [Schizosaccharomyces japonicus yFS275]
MQVSQVGPWELGIHLSSESGGIVRLAKHIETGELAVVKVFENWGDLAENDRDRIEHELLILEVIDHPNVLRVFDVLYEQDKLYVVIEYLPGGELFDCLLKRGSFSESETAAFLWQIICGLEYCHQLCICHRDLKPENMLLDAQGNIKIRDFGMATIQRPGTLLTTSCGSPHYASPEIVNGQQYDGTASDVWSCGVILYALLTGRLPFDDDNVRTLLLKVRKGVFAMPCNISTQAQHLLYRMLDVDPATRITIEGIREHPFLSHLVHPNIPVPVVSAPVNEVDSVAFRQLSVLFQCTEDPSQLLKHLQSGGPMIEKTLYTLLAKQLQQAQSSNARKMSIVEDVYEGMSNQRTPTILRSFSQQSVFDNPNAFTTSHTTQRPVTNMGFVPRMHSRNTSPSQNLSPSVTTSVYQEKRPFNSSFVTAQATGSHFDNKTEDRHAMYVDAQNTMKEDQPYGNVNSGYMSNTNGEQLYPHTAAKLPFVTHDGNMTSTRNFNEVDPNTLMMPPPSEIPSTRVTRAVSDSGVAGSRSQSEMQFFENMPQGASPMSGHTANHTRRVSGFNGIQLPKQRNRPLSWFSSTKRRLPGSPFETKKSFFRRLFSSGPSCKCVYTSLSSESLEREILEVLRRWQLLGVGIVDITYDSVSTSISARLKHQNTLQLKPLRFRVSVLDEVFGSQAAFVLESGSSSTFDKLATEFQLIFEDKGFLDPLDAGVNNYYNTRSGSRLSISSTRSQQVTSNPTNGRLSSFA